MPTQSEKGLAFRALHARPGAFVIPNPWDAGSTLLLNAFGFEALATTSAGHAFALGKRDGDGGVGRAETLANARAIVAATDLPVSADLENGFGDDPAACADTIRAAAAVGLVGGSIEDASGDHALPIYDLALAVERVAAAVEAARSLPTPFLLTAWAENFLHGRPDLEDTIRRLVAFAEVGADVLYAPYPTDLDAVRAIVKAVAPKPVNLVVGTMRGAVPWAELQKAGDPVNIAPPQLGKEISGNHPFYSLGPTNSEPASSCWNPG